MRRLLFIFFLSLFSSAYTQCADVDSTQSKFGVYAGTGWNIHSASFRTLPGQPNCCDEFTDAHGLNIAIGGVYRLAPSKHFFLESRIGYNHLSGVFTRNEWTKVIADNKFIDGLIEHYISANLGTIGIEQFAGVKLFDKISFQAGISFGFLLLKSFHQKEEIIEPSDIGVFSDTKQRVRNDISGSIQDANPLQASALVGVGYDFHLENKWFENGRAEIFGVYQLTNILKDYKWKIFTLRAGVSLMFNKKKTKELIQIDTFKRDSIIIDTIRKEVIAQNGQSRVAHGTPIFSERLSDHSKNSIIYTSIYRQTDTLYFSRQAQCSIDLFEVKQNPRKVKEINIHQQFTTQIFPILTKLFFDFNSSSIPQRYDFASEAATFSTSTVAPHPLVLNHHILNIIGYRMRQYPGSNITIKGYADKTTERADCGLARARAESAKNYLFKYWQIDTSRINCTSSASNCSPKDATVSPIEEGYSENRRIEFESDEPRLLSEIVRSRYLESTFNPANLRTDVMLSDEMGLRSWSFDILSEKYNQQIAHGVEFSDKISFNTDEVNYSLFSSADSITCRYMATYTNGDTVQARAKLAVSRDTSGIEKQIISLTLFLVNNAEVSSQDKKIIHDFAQNLIDGDSVVIIGFTDQLGQFEDNLRLSVLRARNVADYLRSVLTKSVGISSVDGAGSMKLPPQIKSYDTPEERFLSRTVRIEVSRPLGP